MRKGPEAILEFLTARPRILVVTHQRPDGDAIGSALGFSRILNANGITARPIGIKPIPQRFQYLTNAGEIIEPDKDWFAGYDCLAVMDCGDWHRMEDFTIAARKKIETLNIDHHISSKGLGGVEWIEPEASSTGEMVIRLAELAGWKIPSEASDPLWAAIVTDTGRFSYSNSSPAALRAAAICVEKGADVAKATSNIYQSVSRAERFLQTRALLRLTFHSGGKIAETWLDHKDFTEVNAGIDVTSEIVNFTRDTAGVEVGIFFYEMPNQSEIKVSIRTHAPHDATKLAEYYSGGGHMRAAGCTLKESMTQARMTVITKAVQIYFNGKKN